MDEVRIYVKTLTGKQALTVDEAQASVERNFADGGWYFLEQPLRCRADRLPLPDNWYERCLSLVVFNRDKEVRLEPDEHGRFAFRLVAEGDGKKARVRRSNYLLRKHTLTAPMFREKLARLLYSEYFVCDKDGMPVLTASRLSGFAGETWGEAK